LSFLLDTNVISEPTHVSPVQAVLTWLASRSPDELFVSAATIGEVRHGLETCPPGARRQALETWFRESFDPNGGRIIPVDYEIADAWGRLRRRSQLEGRTMPLADALIAATASVHGLTLVTRNVRDFEIWGGPVFNPWTQV
jgi:predicted nucleic acid-binding protein